MTERRLGPLALRLGVRSLQTVRPNIVKRINVNHRNTGLAVIDQGIVGLSNFVVFIVVGRYAGPHQLGLLSLALTIYYLILAVQESLITSPYTIYANKRHGKKRRTYANAVFAQHAIWAMLVTCAGVIASLASYRYGSAGACRLVASCTAFLPFALLREFARRQLFTELRILSVMLLTIVYMGVVCVSLLALTYIDQPSAANALLAMACGGAAAGVAWIRVSGRPVVVSGGRVKASFRRHWKIGRWMFASHVTGLSTNVGMPWVIAGYLGPAATGVFAACDSIVRFANPIIVGTLNVLTPNAALGFSRGGCHELRRIVRQATFVLGFVMALFSLFIALVGRQLLAVFFGGEYAKYAAVLLVTVVSQLVAKLAGAPGRGLLVLERPEANLKAQMYGLIMSVCTAVALVPIYGILGAATSLLCGQIAATMTITLTFQQLITQPQQPHLGRHGARCVAQRRDSELGAVRSECASP